MNSNLVAAAVLVSSSALWFTTHVALCWGLWPRLAVSRSRWLVLLPPTAWLAVVWGFKHGLRARSVGWLVCAMTYVAGLVLST